METYFEFASIVKIFNFMLVSQKKINLHSHEDLQFEGVIDYLSFLRKPSLLRNLDSEIWMLRFLILRVYVLQLIWIIS